MTTAEKLLRERAESYSRDARTFRDAAKTGASILSPREDDTWADAYQIISMELRRVAGELAAGGGSHE